MPTTSNFGWTTPADTDLVKDGALAIRTLGNGIDTSMAELKGGTTGQILSKTSNTDMDFTWINNDQGDITAVNVTSPITGGGTSGAVTLGIQSASTTQSGAVQLENSTSSTSTTTAAVPASVKSAYDLANAAIPKSTVTTNGDLIYGTGSATVARLGIGSTGNVLTVSGGVPVWAAPAGGGKVLQVVSATYSTQVTSTSTTYVDTGLTASITPSSTSSKVLVLFTQTTQADGAGDAEIRLRLFRGATQLGNNFTQLYTGVNAFRSAMLGSAYLDSPSSTSSLTYKTDFSNNAGGNVRVNINGSTSTITLLEIGA